MKLILLVGILIVFIVLVICSLTPSEEVDWFYGRKYSKHHKKLQTSYYILLVITIALALIRLTTFMITGV